MRSLAFFLIVSFGVSSTVAFAYPKDADALKALEKTEAKLREHENDGSGLAVKTALQFIQAAKALGVLNLPAIVGYVKDKGGGAEFGSVDSGLRLTGNIPRTALAMAVTVDDLHEGISMIMVHVVLPRPIEFRGYQGKEINMYIVYVPNERRAAVTLKTGNYREEISRDRLLRHGLELRAQFGTDAPAPESWGDVGFREELDGITNVSKYNGKKLPEKCKNMGSGVVRRRLLN